MNTIKIARPWLAARGRVIRLRAVAVELKPSAINAAATAI